MSRLLVATWRTAGNAPFSYIDRVADPGPVFIGSTVGLFKNFFWSRKVPVIYGYRSVWIFSVFILTKLLNIVRHCFWAYFYLYTGYGIYPNINLTSCHFEVGSSWFCPILPDPFPNWGVTYMLPVHVATMSKVSDTSSLHCGRPLSYWYSSPWGHYGFPPVIFSFCFLWYQNCSRPWFHPIVALF